MFACSQFSLPDGSRNRPIGIRSLDPAGTCEQRWTFAFLSELEGFGA
jgi:hypothetical protein